MNLTFDQIMALTEAGNDVMIRNGSGETSVYLSVKPSRSSRGEAKPLPLTPAEKQKAYRERIKTVTSKVTLEPGTVTNVTSVDNVTENSLPPLPSPSLPPSPPSPDPSLPAHPHAPTHTHPPTRGEAELPLVLETEEPPPPATPSPFDHFWKAYPKKKAKESAQKSWDRQKLNSKLAEIIAAVEAQKRTTDWTRESGRFIPHPATWLNSHRWEDDTSGNNPNIIEAIDTENIPEFNPETDVCPF